MMGKIQQRSNLKTLSEIRILVDFECYNLASNPSPSVCVKVHKDLQDRFCFNANPILRLVIKKTAQTTIIQIDFPVFRCRLQSFIHNRRYITATRTYFLSTSLSVYSTLHNPKTSFSKPSLFRSSASISSAISTSERSGVYW